MFHGNFVSQKLLDVCAKSLNYILSLLLAVVAQKFYCRWKLNTITNSNHSEYFLYCGTEFSFADRIDDRVTQCADEESTGCCKNYLGRDIDSWNELTANAHKPAWEIAQNERRDDDGDIDSCLAVAQPPRYDLLLLRVFSISHLDVNGVYLPSRRLVHRPVQKYDDQEWHNKRRDR